MLTLVALLAMAVQDPQSDPCTMLSLLRAPSRSPTMLRERIDVCGERRLPGRRVEFAFTLLRRPRGAPAETLYASTRTCPAAREQLVRAERLPVPTIEILPRDPPILSPGDGTLYRLDVYWAPYRAEGEQAGLRIESNVRTPLARWADGLFDSLSSCWREAPTPPAPPPASR